MGARKLRFGREIRCISDLSRAERGSLQSRLAVEDDPLLLEAARPWGLAETRYTPGPATCPVCHDTIEVGQACLVCNATGVDRRQWPAYVPPIATPDDGLAGGTGQVAPARRGRRPGTHRPSH